MRNRSKPPLVNRMGHSVYKDASDTITIPSEALRQYVEEESRRAIERLPRRGTDRWTRHSIREEGSDPRIKKGPLMGSEQVAIVVLISVFTIIVFVTLWIDAFG